MLSTFLLYTYTKFKLCFKTYPSGEIRTPDLVDPNHLRYQTAPHSDNSEVTLPSGVNLVYRNGAVYGNRTRVEGVKTLSPTIRGTLRLLS